MGFIWDSKAYLQFETQRNVAIYDLLSTLQRHDIKRSNEILDVGCGPGNSTKIIAKYFPSAKILGIDNSENMLKTAQDQNNMPHITFSLYDADISLPMLEFDIIIANASLQWITNQERFFHNVFNILQEDGIFGAQIPIDTQSLFHQTLQDLVTSQKWRTHFHTTRMFHSLKSLQYWDILKLYTHEITMWETTYFHVLENIAKVIEWYGSSGLRPYLQILAQEEQQEFLNDLSCNLIQAYSSQSDIILQVPRLFFIAKKGRK